jgi:hypothetical protein
MSDTAKYFYFYKKHFFISWQLFLNKLNYLVCCNSHPKKEVITSSQMGVTAHWIGQKIAKLLPEEEETLVSQINLPGCIIRYISTFS